MTDGPPSDGVSVDASTGTGSNDREVEIAVDGNDLDRVRIEKLWTDWNVVGADPDRDRADDGVADDGVYELRWPAGRTSPSITIAIPERYVGGAYELDVTATDDRGVAAETTVTFDLG